MDAPRSVVLVEGISDKRAVEAFAVRHGRDLEADGIAIVAMGGAQAIGRFVHTFGPHGLDVGLAGLCDANEERYFRRALERSGLGSDLTREDMEALGFYVCVDDLEDELTRAVGVARVEQVIEAEGEAAAFRTFQKQPEKRGLTLEQQLHAFMWNRKLRYASLLVEALDLARAPRPLDRMLAHVESQLQGSG
jgi:Overcoming lysogenization defect protein-like, TOPRIM domain